jgi:hypothetical protein
MTTLLIEDSLVVVIVLSMLLTRKEVSPRLLGSTLLPKEGAVLMCAPNDHWPLEYSTVRELGKSNFESLLLLETSDDDNSHTSTSS